MDDQTKSLSQKVYELLVHGADEGATLVGRIISYDDLLDVGCDISQSRSPVYQAATWLLNNHGHNLACVRGVGYQIVTPDEAPRLVDGQIRGAEKRIQRGRNISEKTTREGMSGQVRTQMQATLTCILGLQLEMREMKRRQDLISRIVADHTQDIEQLKQSANIPFTAEQTQALKEMLAEQASKRFAH